MRRRITLNGSRKVFVAGPYKEPVNGKKAGDLRVALRVRTSEQVAAVLVKDDNCVFCYPAYFHHIISHLEKPPPVIDHILSWLRSCDGLILLDTPGHERSAEMALLERHAKEVHLPVLHLSEREIKELIT